MAEAQQQSNSNCFCHKCEVSISPTNDFACPRCNSGFIEVIENPERGTDTSSDSDDAFEIIQDRVLRNGPERRSRRRRGRFVPVPLHRNSSQSNSDSDPYSGSERNIIQAVMQLTSGILETVGSGGAGEIALISDRFGLPMMVTSNLASNPGDYAWGRGGLDAIITQLMNQLDGTGPAPLAEDKIKKIPVVHITKEQCDKNLQCSVCMEDFVEKDPVRRLDCDHHYHENCIVPWLQLHATCPVCRKTLHMDEDGSQNTPNNNSEDALGSNLTVLMEEDLE